MDKMRVYLDNCCYNRPYDGQVQLRIRLETEAKLHVQDLMHLRVVEYAWSGVLDYEVGNSPYQEQIEDIMRWKLWATVDIPLDYGLIARGEQIMTSGVKQLDALHLACAEAAGCNWFLTTDGGILKKIKTLGTLKIANPIDFIMETRI